MANAKKRLKITIKLKNLTKPHKQQSRKLNRTSCNEIIKDADWQMTTVTIFA